MTSLHYTSLTKHKTGNSTDCRKFCLSYLNHRQDAFKDLFLGVRAFQNFTFLSDQLGGLDWGAF